MTLYSRAWMLDAVGFHREIDSVFDRTSEPLGDVRLRERATRTWYSSDPIEQAYLEVVPTGSPEDWEAALDDSHLVDWYRVLMARHLVPTRAYHAPEVLKARLPDLGLSPSEARRIALGRELQLLAEAHAAPDVSARLSLHLTMGTKGWLDHDDVTAAIARLRRLDRSAFRGQADLVPVVENAYEVLEAAATKPDHVLLLVAG
jgi:hypothetical protein